MNVAQALLVRHMKTHIIQSLPEWLMHSDVAVSQNARVHIAVYNVCTVSIIYVQ